MAHTDNKTVQYQTLFTHWLSRLFKIADKYDMKIHYVSIIYELHNFTKMRMQSVPALTNPLGRFKWIGQYSMIAIVHAVASVKEGFHRTLSHSSDEKPTTAKRNQLQPWPQPLWGHHGAHLRPTGPRCAPSWFHDTCYLGAHLDDKMSVRLFFRLFWSRKLFSLGLAGILKYSVWIRQSLL